MLFMSVFTYEPDKRDEVMKRRLDRGAMIPPGMKVLGEWSDVTGGRVFRLIEHNDARLGLAASAPWTDLGKIEIFSVMPTEEALELAKSRG